MRQIIYTICLLLILKSGIAQNRFAIVKYNKTDVPAVLGEFPFEESITKDALVNYFEKKGFKSKTNKGYTIFSGMLIPELGQSTLDIYFTVNRKSRQDKDKAVVTMLLSKGYENFVSDTSNPAIIDSAKKYLYTLVEIVAAYDLELKIEEQEKVVKKSTNKMSDLVEDGVKLVKRKKEIEEDIVKNTADQASQKQDKENQEQILNNLKQKRKVASNTKSPN